MSNESERDLVALVAAEQRGFRNILYAGMATLVVLVLMSVALGGYYFYVSQRLNETSLELQRDAFRSRREMDAQSNRVADQGRRLRRMSFEMRRAGSGDTPADAAAALASARIYLMTGRLPYDDERLIEAVDDANTGSPAMQSLMNGVSTLISWERNGDSVAQDAEELPRRMQRALTSFESVRSDPALAPLGAAGVAWVRYIETSSSLSNYAADDCNALIETVTASAENASIGPQPLWWRAQCERKMGHPDAALRDYAAALEQSYERALEVRTGGGGGGGRNMQAELTLAMNAFHGVGTSLIALHDAPDSDADKAAGLDVARRACAIDEPIAQAPDLQLAEACLRIAVSLRQRIGQTPNQVSGSAENLGFVYLRDGNFQAAFDHAQRVERTGLFAWNELVRTISASHLRSDPDARAAARRARRNVSFFTVGNFNLCEVQMLLNADLYAEADQLVRREHPDEDVVACAQS